MVKLIALLKRMPGFTREEFARRWLDEHILLSSKMPGLRGYYVNICTSYQPEGTGEEPLYDGTAELWWDSVEDMEKGFASEEGRIAGEDADTFATVRLHLYTDEHAIIPFRPRAGAGTRKRTMTRSGAQAKAGSNARARSGAKAKARPKSRARAGTRSARK